MLRKLRIRKTQKYGLLLVFSVCLLTIALELFRFVRNITGDQTTNNILYAVINANLTIIISCTPAYRSLWTLWQKSRSKLSFDSSSSEGYPRIRQSIQKPAVFEDKSLWSDRSRSAGPAIPLQAFHQGRSRCNFRSVQTAVSQPPSYRP